MEFAGEYYCPSCFHTEKRAEVDGAHACACPKCQGNIMKANYILGEINPLLFRRAGWGDNVSAWEEIKWRAR